MKTRNVFLLFAGVILLTMAPSAMAQAMCMRCQLAPPQCVRAFHTVGNLGCFTDATGCHLFDDPCGPSSAAALASDYVVVSVERTEELQPAQRAQFVAPETKPTAVPTIPVR